jgi:hypothetical protein
MSLNIDTLISDVVNLSKDKAKYNLKIKEVIRIPPEIVEIVNKFDYKVIQNDSSPRVTIKVDFGSYQKDDFKVSYIYFLHFSKFCNIYTDTFYYKVMNLDPDKLEPAFENDSYEPLTKTQYIFHKQIKDKMDLLSFKSIKYEDLIKPVMNLNFVNESFKFFGPVPNVEMILFNDFFDIVVD